MIQYWLKASWLEFGELLNRLDGQMPNAVNDVEIMHQSDFMSEDRIQQIRDFINNHHGNLNLSHQQLLQYVDTDLRRFLEIQLRSYLVAGAEKLINGEGINAEERMILAVLKLG